MEDFFMQSAGDLDQHCPFIWGEDSDNCYLVSRWNGFHTDGPKSEFRRGTSRGHDSALIPVAQPKGRRPKHSKSILEEYPYFGKYKLGEPQQRPWKKIPRQYLIWCQENLKGNRWKRTQKVIAQVIAARRLQNTERVT